MRAYIVMENMGEGLFSGPIGGTVDERRDHELKLTEEDAERWAPAEWDDAEVVNVLVVDDLLTVSARVLRIVNDPENAQHDGADPWLVGSTLEPDVPRAVTDHVIELLIKDGYIGRGHGHPHGEPFLYPIDYEEA